ncbi:hypothetical protein GW17_00031816 [Ensete ventricosum]|nr:hypothetical protein GW17_00031816 [Ensete ventricosum]
MKLQQDDEPISSLSIGPGFVRCSEILSEFARRFVEGIRKLTGNMSIDCQKKIIGLTARMPEAARMAGIDKSSCYERKKLRRCEDEEHNQEEVEDLALVANHDKKD